VKLEPGAVSRARRSSGGDDVSARVLVAGEDAATADVLREFFQAKGFEVVTAADGNQAVELGSESDFALVVLDVHMPVYDGVEVIELLRRRHVLHPAKVIALTAGLSEPVRVALEAGRIDAYVTKPVELAKLGAQVDRLTAATRSA
jgi:two-component system, OmpR family, KDP operon response regulator KdpE